MLLLDSLKTICATRYPFLVSKISDLCTEQILIIRRCIWFTEPRRMAAQASRAKHRFLPLQVSYSPDTSFAIFVHSHFLCWIYNATVGFTLKAVTASFSLFFLSELSGRDQLGNLTLRATTTSSALASKICSV